MQNSTVWETWSKAGFQPPLVVNTKDGSVLVHVPGGEFEMGDGQNTNCPKHKVYLDAYYIGIYCVTNEQYARFVKATGHRVPDHADYGEPVWHGGSFPAEKAKHPVVCVSWDDAVEYGKWSGLRLPTEAEWERAARGPGGFIYPWGNEWDAEKCRHDGNKGNEKTCRVFDYPGGVSGYGTYNQSGNVWEWCSDRYGDYDTSGVQRNPQGSATGSGRVYRGGSWFFVASGCRAAYRFRYAPGLRGGYGGFRLVRASPAKKQ